MLDTCTIAPVISVLIPARNGAGTLNELLAMLSIQTVPVREILLADSGSEDETVAIAKRYGAQVIAIEAQEFDHGGTRTMLARRAAGDILVFFTQDTIPRKKDALERLIAPFYEDEEIAATYGRQLPAFGADFFSASLRKFNYPATSEVRSLRDRERLGLKTAFTSNSFAAYRRVFLVEIGFFSDDLIFGEDTIAVARLLQGGRKIAYAADAEAYHSHNYDAIEEFRRYFDIGVLHSDQNWFIRMLGSANGEGKKYLRFVLRAITAEGRYSLLPAFFFRTFMKYCGYHLGRRYRYLPGGLVARLSLHRQWWGKRT